MSDGIDHINIYSKGQTELGRGLSNFSGHRVFTTDGTFASIEGYWYWLNTHHPRRDELCTLIGWAAKALGRELRANDWNPDGAFKLKVAMAMLSKLILHPELYALFRASTLPFRHYYVYGGKVNEPSDGRWIVNTWEFMRRLVREDSP